MKKLLMLAAAAAAILPMTAQAARPANGQVTVTTTVQETCAISGLNKGTKGASRVYQTFNNADGGVFQNADAAVKFESADLVNSTTARAKAVDQELELSAFCNFGGHTVALQSDNGGLTDIRNTGSNDDFHRRIAYTAKITQWGNFPGELAELDTPLTSLTTSGATPTKARSEVDREIHATKDKPAILTINTVAGNLPLVKGNYSDVLKIRLGGGF